MEKHKISTGELEHAESMLSPEQRNMSMEREQTYKRIRENFVAQVDQTLDYLDTFHKKIPESLEAQCQDRFGCGWEEIKAQVMNDLESMSRWNTHIDDIAFEGTSGHWMINPLLMLYELKKNMEKEKLDVPENAYGFGGRFDMERRLNQMIEENVNDGKKPSQRDLYYVAPVLTPDRVLEVLKGHGIEIED